MEDPNIIEEYELKKTYIFDNANDLAIEDRREILQIIYNSHFRNKLNEKGGGIQINIDELSNAMIDKLNNFICDRMKDNILEF